MPAVLITSVLSVTITSTAMAAGQPSVGLPTVPSVPVSEQKMGARAQDQASKEALHGNQSAGGSAKEGGGNNKATPLSQSATWDVSAQTGDFSWSYPLRVPPAPGGLEPKLALSYASSGVDGRTSATNNQASWIGDGWNLGVGFVERSYRPCADDTMGGTTPPKEVGDLCWRSDNATASFGGGGGELVRDDESGEWHTRTDDGSRVERLNGVANGDDDQEYWRITTVDGTQYFFGSRPDSSSTWTVPVFGDDEGEPCHQATFAASHCVQAWRWNLDKVVDRHGNVIEYDYDTEENSYGLNNKDTAVSYVRGGTLKSAEYGLHEGSDKPATGKVEFTTADRCVPGSECTEDKKENWPDVTWADKCDGATCDKDHRSPTFWDTARLDKVTTKVWTGNDYSDVDQWQLGQEFPTNGDGEKPALWLKSITHTGLAGTAVSLPPVTFEGTKMANRVNKLDGIGPLLRYRVTAVVSETGGVTTVKYKDSDCTENSLPTNPESNTQRCFPQWWAKKDQSERMDYFNKYVIDQVTMSDRISANTEQVTSYDYIGGAGWAYDTSEFTKDDKRTWNDFRGFSDVRTKQGKPNDPSGPITMKERYFYRGLNGDKQPEGVRDVKITDSEGGERVDDDWLRGQEYETQVHDGEGDTILEKTISTPYFHGPTATRGTIKAYQVRQGVVDGYTALAAGGWRKSRSEQAYDDNGLPVSASDLGDLSVPTDDRCNRTTYHPNTGKWLLNLVARTEVVAVACTATPSFPKDAIADTITAYDGKAFDEAPDAGNPTRVEELDQRPSTEPVYTLKSTATYDDYGRPTAAADALGRTTTTRYVPETGGPTTQIVVTNPANQVTTKTLEPFYGQEIVAVDANNRKTETTYDALGRKTEVWLPNRIKTPTARGNYQYSYAYHNDAPSVVTTTEIGPNGNFTSSKEIYDGLLRLRQAQGPASGGGRLIVDSRFDSQGRQFKTTAPYFNDAAVDDKLWVASDADIPTQNFVEYDGAGREKAKIVKAGTAEKWRTTTQYGGDRVHVTPPSGGTPVTGINDAHGNVVELRQYHGAPLTSEYDSIKYTYTTSGKRAGIVDAAGSVWGTSYDLHGRVVKEESPDKGVSTVTYDEVGRVRTTTDGRGTTLTADYDVLGRKTKLTSGTTTLAEWTYDTALFGKGLPASSTRYANGAAYTSTTLGYNPLNQPLRTQVTIPQTEQTLAGTYSSAALYNMDGSRASATYATIGSLPSEALQFAYNDLGQPTTTTGGYDGRTDHLVTGTDYTRYGEVQRTQLGDEGKRVWLSRYYDTDTRRLNRSIVDAEVPNPMQTDTNYTYDPSGNIKSIVDKPVGQVADTQCFQYDYLQRLTQAWTPGAGCDAAPGTGSLTGPAPYWLSYTYDKAGDRLSETQHASGGDTVRTSTYPAPGGSHVLKSVETKSPSGTKTDAFAYDAMGNTTTRGAQQLEWDAEGHLAKITEAGKTSEFVYDADGGRLIRRDPTSTTLYLGGQELRLVKATGKLEPTRYYQQGTDTVAMRDSSGLTWLASDYQSTAQVAVKSSDLSVARRRQLPFGGPRGAAVSFPGEKGFVGGIVDAAVGLTQLGARAYDATLGRFMSVDPLIDAAAPQQLNGYTYSDNSPLMKSDPTGLAWWLSALGAIAGVVAMATPVGAVFAIATAISVGVAAYDTINESRKGNYASAAFAAVGALTGGVALVAKLAARAGFVAHSTAEVTEAYTGLTSAGSTFGGAGLDYQHTVHHDHETEMWQRSVEKYGIRTPASMQGNTLKDRYFVESVQYMSFDDDCIPKIAPNGQNRCSFQKPKNPLIDSFCHGPGSTPALCQAASEGRIKPKARPGAPKVTGYKNGGAVYNTPPSSDQQIIWPHGDGTWSQGTTGRSWS